MKVFKINSSLTNVPKLNKKLCLCLGYFDGVHIAHQRLINEAKVTSDDQIGIITFDSGVKGKESITSLDDRLNLFKALKVDYVFVFSFSKAFKNLSAEQFKKKFLDKVNPTSLIAGHDFKFGKNRQGDTTYLKKYYKVHVVDFLKKNNKKISSNDIISFIKEGNIKKANEYLGRAYQIKGRVIHGLRNGSKLNFPTANIKILDNYVVPRFGVYKVITYINGIPRLGIANVGIHPTIDKLKAPLLEVNIQNFSANIYGKEIYVEFVDFVRPEKKFKNEKELIKQIKKDISSLKSLQ
ncbi:MAG: riboflavin biosynthesis protein RibF [Bacilli bacterium]|nr:riboflavin biosynthesis protein RibF [Bacilli bacterium]